MSAIPDVQSLGIGLTRCYRRGMDGPVSVILHNLVQALPDDVWSRYVTELRDRLTALGRFDAEALMSQSLGAVDAMDGRGRQNHPEDRLAKRVHPLACAFRGALELLDARDWVTLTDAVRACASEEDVPVAETSDARDLLSRSCGAIRFETRVWMGDVLVGSISPVFRGAVDGAGEGWTVDVVGAATAREAFPTHEAAMLGAKRAVDDAVIGRRLAEVEPARVEAHVARGLPTALDPDDAVDRAVLAAGAHGTLLLRKVVAGERDEPERDAVEYLFAQVTGGVVHLRGWRVGVDRATGAVGDVRSGLRHTCECLALDMERRGRMDRMLDRDADLVRGRVQADQEDGAVTFRVALVQETRHPDGPWFEHRTLAERVVRVSGRCVPERAEAARATP